MMEKTLPDSDEMSANPCIQPEKHTEFKNISFKTRCQWGAKSPKSGVDDLTRAHPLRYVIVTYTCWLDVAVFGTEQKCDQAVRKVQDLAFEKGWSDIPYSFLVSESGVIYEGRGCNGVPATALGWNPVCIGVAFIGDFFDRRPSENAFDALAMFLDRLVDEGVLVPDFTIYSLGQVRREKFSFIFYSEMQEGLKALKSRKGYSWSWKEYDKITPIKTQTFLHDVRMKPTILHQAVKKGNVNTVKALIRHADTNMINAQDFRGRTALHESCETSFLEITKCILDDINCDVNIRDGTQRTPLHAAVEVGNIQAAHMLLNHTRCDINAKTSEGQTVVHIAAKRAAKAFVSYTRAINLIISVNDRKDMLSTVVSYFYDSPTLLETDYLNNNALTLFMKEYGDIGKYRNGTFYEDCIEIMSNRTDLVKALPHTLLLAIETGTSKTCEILIKSGVSTNSSLSNAETPLHRAIRIDSFDKCKLLIDNGALLTSKWRDMTPYQYAISFGCKWTILNLLKQNMEQRDIANDLKIFSYFGAENELSTYCANHCNEIQSSEHLHQNETQPQQESVTFQMTSVEVNSLCTKTIPERIDVNKDVLVNLIAASASCNTHLETKGINTCVMVFLYKLSKCLAENPETSIFQFLPVLSGSMAEGTKTFLANEYDYICQFLNVCGLKLCCDEPVCYIQLKECSPWNRLKRTQHFNGKPVLCGRKVASCFYNALTKVIQLLIKRGHICVGKLFLHRESLELKNKISSLQLIWRGQHYKNIIIHVDLVPAFHLESYTPEVPLPYCVPNVVYHMIAKTSRHEYDDSPMHTGFVISHACAENAVISSLPRNMKLGYLIAKAIRISAISNFDVKTLILEDETIQADDFVTSYMLKTCLFRLINESDDHSGNMYIWAERIYGYLGMRIQQRMLGSHYSHEQVFACDEPEGDMLAPCCYRRKIVLGMVGKILSWFRSNKSELERITYGIHLVYSRP